MELLTQSLDLFVRDGIVLGLCDLDEFVEVVAFDLPGHGCSDVGGQAAAGFGSRTLGIVNPELRLLKHQLGRDLDATSTKAEKFLGWRARPIEDTIAETAESLLAHGIGTKTRS